MPNTIDILNQLASTATVSESSGVYKPHPLGEFHCVVTEVEYKPQVGRFNSPVQEVKVSTTDNTGKRVGYTSENIWMFKTEEVHQADNNPELKNSILNKLSKIKSLFSDLGLYTVDQANSLQWTNGGESSRPAGMLESFSLLVGRRGSVVVVADKNNPGKVKAYINAPKPSVTGEDQAPVTTTTRAMGAAPGAATMTTPTMGNPMSSYKEQERMATYQQQVSQPLATPPQQPLQAPNNGGYVPPQVPNLNDVPF